MKIDRRAFGRLFGAAALGAVVDPERLAWIPGAKKTFDLWTPASVELTNVITRVSIDPYVLSGRFVRAVMWCGVTQQLTIQQSHDGMVWTDV